MKFISIRLDPTTLTFYYDRECGTRWCTLSYDFWVLPLNCNLKCPNADYHLFWLGRSFPAKSQKYALMNVLPKSIIPRIKNCTTMEEIWKELDAGYGNPKDLVLELINFIYYNPKASEAFKFLEL